MDADGNEEIDEDLIPEKPEDLLEKRIDFVVEIMGAQDLPENFCKDVYVEYQIYLEETKYRTESVAGKNRNPDFNYQKQHTQSVVTENFLKYIKSECLVFKLFGFPDVKRQPAETQAQRKKKQLN